MMNNVKNDLNFNLVLQTLNEACFGSNIASQQNAMKLVQQLEGHDGIISALLTVIEQSSHWKTEIRLLSSISLKNVIGKRWTNRGGKTLIIAQEEKELLQKFVISYLHEPESKISLQLAICAGKIARYDWPDRWPNLFIELFHSFEYNDDLLKQKRTLYLIHECIRELGEKNMPTTKVDLAITSVSIFTFLSPIWCKYCQLLLDCLDGTFISDQLHSILEHVFIITRILQKSLEKGYIEIDKSNIDLGYFYSQFVSYFDRFAFIINTHNHHVSSSSDTRNTEQNEFEINEDIFSFQVDVISSLSSSDSNRTIVVSALTRLVKDMAMIPTALQKDYPLEIGRYLGPFLDFYCKQLFQQYNFSDSALLENKVNRYPLNYSLTTSSVVFLSNSISCQKYVVGVDETSNNIDESYEISKSCSDIKEGDLNHKAHIASVVRDTFFNENMILLFLKLCIHRLLQYSPAELQEWSDCPEQFFLSQQDLSEEDNLKTATEAFFLGILEKEPKLVCTFLLSFLKDSDKQLQMVHCDNVFGEELILFYNSVYLCAGLAASTFSQYGHSIDWINNIIGPLLSSLLQNSSLFILIPCQQFLRTRLLWLLSCFMYQFNVHLITDILSLINICLSCSNIDILCLLTAIETLQAVLKCDTFQPSIHGSCLSTTASMLCVAMTQRLEENEAKLICVNVLGDLVEYMSKPHLISLLNDFCKYFSYLWKKCVESDPLKSSVIETLTRIISYAGSDGHSAEMYDVVFPMLYVATSGAIESSYLVRDGITMWLNLARSIPLNSYNQRFNDLYNARYASLFDNDIFGDNYEDMKDIMLISEACVIAGGPWFFKDCALQFQKVYSKIICNTSPRVVPYVIRPIESMLVVYPHEALAFLVDSTFLFQIARTCTASIPTLNSVLSAYVEADVALISYLSVIARLCLLNPASLRETSENVAKCIANGIASGNFDMPNGSIQFSQTDADLILFGWIRLLVDKFDSVGYSSGGSWRRRLWVFALLSLYPSHDPCLLDMFPEVLNVALDVINEEQQTADDNQEKAAAKIVELLISKEEDTSGWIDASSASATDNLADPPNSAEKEAIFSAFTPYIAGDAVTYTSLLDASKLKLRIMMELCQGTDLIQQLDVVVGDAIKLFQ